MPDLGKKNHAHVLFLSEVLVVLSPEVIFKSTKLEEVKILARNTDVR